MLEEAWVLSMFQSCFWTSRGPNTHVTSCWFKTRHASNTQHRQRWPRHSSEGQCHTFFWALKACFLCIVHAKQRGQNLFRLSKCPLLVQQAQPTKNIKKIKTCNSKLKACKQSCVPRNSSLFFAEDWSWSVLSCLVRSRLFQVRRAWLLVPALQSTTTFYKLYHSVLQSIVLYNCTGQWQELPVIMLTGKGWLGRSWTWLASACLSLMHCNLEELSINF